ncbi:MAG: hypothetical protein KW806_02940 [Candidatus Yanofskybacteria bacterium]|nr:hypothetical protein [Candidatus Yanofskybacteria bacterium]
MKKVIVSFLIVTSLGVPVMASPLTDFIVGAVFMVNGGVFEVIRSGAAGNKDDADKKAATAAASYEYNIGGANYYAGVAAWEFAQHGNTANYQSFYATGLGYYNSSQSDLASKNKYSSEAFDSRGEEKVYKGVSLTSFSIGGVMILKAGVTYWLNRRNTQSASLIGKIEKHLALAPTPDMRGAQLAWEQRF